MKITEIFKTQKRTFSFEFFPPKDEISAVDFGINVGQLLKLNPSFVTVTYGAGGSTQDRTFALVDYLQNKIGLTCMAHYTCVNATKEKVEQDLNYLKSTNIKNIMLLRGDSPQEIKDYSNKKNDFQYASELIQYVSKRFDFCLAGASYVDKHPEAPSLKSDIQNLKIKVDSGAEFLLTQLFFDNKSYFNFIEVANKYGINCRIIPGIIPITSYRQIERFTQMSGTKIPNNLLEKLNKYKKQPDIIYKIGIENTIEQCRELLKKGAPGLHFYTLNKSRAAIEIFETLLKDLI